VRDDGRVTATASRLLELLALLQARRDWPGPELARRLGVSERTVRRDVDRLRRLGYPVGSLTGPAGRYRLAPGTAMPPLLLDEDEAVAIAVGLRTAAWSAVEGIEETSLRALVKLEQVLPAHLRERVRDVGATATASPAGDGPTVDAQHLALLGAARRDGERVRFTYRRRDGDTARREVEPHALVAIGRRWYLVGWDVRREGWRTFRIDRIADPAAAAVRFAPREVPGGDPVAFVAAGRRARMSRHEARLTVHAPAEAVRRRLPGGWGEVTPIDEGSCAVRTGDDDLGWLVHRVALLDAEVVVHEPPELRESLAEMGRRLLRAGAEPARPAAEGTGARPAGPGPGRTPGAGRGVSS
jgi:predicted DNA-binding transcriptional regulator YafY